MAEESGDGVQAYAAVDGLGGQGVAELMGGDVTDAGLAGEPVQGVGDAMEGDWPVVLEEQQVRP